MRGWTALIIWAVLVAVAAAESFPARPITLVVPFPAGGAADGVGRTIADAMRDHI
jgi:tripartite-type tricarboxylate transporter receptor subunit TctC